MAKRRDKRAASSSDQNCDSDTLRLQISADVEQSKAILDRASAFSKSLKDIWERFAD